MAEVQGWTTRKSQVTDLQEDFKSSLDKLDTYIERINVVPAYVLAMSKWFSFDIESLFDCYDI